MWRVVVRPRAEADLDEARQWYELQRAGLGDKFVDDIRKAVLALESDADSRSEYYRGFRRVLIRRFPYKLFYRIEDDRVVIFRILHSSRDHRQTL
jgi:toxin ParE1/3/4